MYGCLATSFIFAILKASEFASSTQMFYREMFYSTGYYR